MRATTLVVASVALVSFVPLLGCKAPRDFFTDGVVYVRVSNRTNTTLHNGRLGFPWPDNSLRAEFKLFDSLAAGHAVERRFAPRLGEWPIVVRLTMNGRELSSGWLGDTSIQPLRASLVVYADSVSGRYYYD